MSASLEPCVIYLSLVSLLSNLSVPNDTPDSMNLPRPHSHRVLTQGDNFGSGHKL